MKADVVRTAERPPRRQHAARPPRPRRTAWRRHPLGALLASALLLLGAERAAAQHQVSGTVTAADHLRPLSGVTVTIKGTTIGTLTDQQGRYSLRAPSPNDTLLVASIGYQQRDVAINGRATVNISLETQAVALQEIVVVGYGTQQRRDVTGAVATVDAEEITRVKTPSVDQALQGRVAGVQVTPASGEPGEPAVVRIRGVGTLGDASPLYVVDGMLLDDISFLNPNDIRSVEVLKDASATAIYGSRGANGVIIVSTRQGDAEAPTRFTISAYAGIQSVQRQLDLVNAQQYAQLANELAASQGVPNYFPNPSSVGPGVDWQDQIFDTAPIQNYQLTSSGGSDRVRYYFSGNYVEQAGVIPKSDFRRVTFRINNDYDLTQSIRFGHNLNFAYTDDQRAPDVLSSVYRADPTIAPLDENGNFTDVGVRSSAGNPLAAIHYTRNGQEGTRLVGNLFAELDFLRNFHARSSFGLDHEGVGFRSFAPQFFVSPEQQNQISDLTVESITNSSWLWENTVDYNYTSDRHRLSLLGGITAQQFYNEVLGGSRTNIAGESPSLWYLEAGDAEGQTNRNTAFDWRMLSYLFRTNYTLLDRYLLTASLRVDGSSRFGEENRYGWFPSFALGWNLDQEAFFEPFRSTVSNLKLRGSWGQIGNDKIGAYPGIALVQGNLNAVFGQEGRLNYGASPISLSNPDIQWETTTQTNVGADLALFQGAVQATLDWYRRNTDGILVEVPIPRYVGSSSFPTVNAAEVLNSGLEATVNWNGSFGAFDVELGANGSWIHNEVVSLGGGREEILGGGLGEYGFSTRTVPGHPIGSFWGYRVEGVFQTPEEIANSPRRGSEQPGDLRFADLDGNGRITEADKTFIGSPIPDFIYGFNAGLDWGGFDLSATFSGQAGNQIYNGKKSLRFEVENFEASYLNRWTGPGTSNTEPRITNAGHNYQVSERFIEDGSFLKLQTAQLGYQLSEDLAARLGAARARVYVSGTNLFTWADYSGYTPELTGSSVIASGIEFFGGIYPPVRTITAGVDLTF